MADFPTPEKMARTVRWIVLIFIAYVFLTNVFGTPKKPVSANITAGQTAPSKDCDKGNSLKDFSLFAVPLIPTVGPALRMQDITNGTGEAAHCGQHATIRYSYSTINNQIIFSNLDAKDKPETVTIGAGELLLGAERGIIGTKVGGVRTLFLPPTLAFANVKDVHTLRGNAEFKAPPAFDSKNESILVKLSLAALSPSAPSSPMPLRVIDSKFGEGSEIQCGDTVRADITVWKLDGTKLFSTLGAKPLTITLGHSQVSFGIEQAILGMKIGGKRSLIMPPAYARRIDETAPTDSPLMATIFPSQEMVLVEIEPLPALEEAAPIKK